MRRHLILALGALALFGCKKAPEPLPGMSLWQSALLQQPIEIGWGYDQGKYEELGSTKVLDAAQTAELRSKFATPRVGNRFKCIIHIDGALSAGNQRAELCFGCGILVAGPGPDNQYAFDKNDLRAFFEKVLGPRPGGEPSPWDKY